jgi:hypothetical protein
MMVERVERVERYAVEGYASLGVVSAIPILQEPNQLR